MELRVISWAGAFGDQWCVVREDGRIVFSDPNIRVCLRWVRTWGATLGQTKRGMELAPRWRTPWSTLPPTGVQS